MDVMCDDIRREAIFYYTVLLLCVLGLAAALITERVVRYKREHMND